MNYHKKGVVINMKEKLKKEIFVDMSLAISPSNQKTLSELCEKILVMFDGATVYEYKMNSKAKVKIHSLDKYIEKNKEKLKESLYISRDLINIYNMKQKYNNMSCCFINEYTNDFIEVAYEHEVPSISQIQKRLK